MAQTNFDIKHIPAEKFRFVQENERLHDKELQTKPIGYFKDAWMRFKKNKASVTAAIILMIIILYAIIVPFVSIYDIGDKDPMYKKVLPKLEIGGLKIFSGNTTMSLNDKYLPLINGIGIAAVDPNGDLADYSWDAGRDSEFNALVSVGEDTVDTQGKVNRVCVVDTYNYVGFQYLSMTPTSLEKLLKWQEETGIQAVYPMIDIYSDECGDSTDANLWYKSNAKLYPLDENGKAMKDLATIQEKGYQPNYLRDSEGNIAYTLKRDKNTVQIRVLYARYYQYTTTEFDENGNVAKLGHLPIFTFGADGSGYDIATRMAYGLRLSLVLSLGVATVCFIFGAFYGAIEGYYGGWTDIIMERIVDILWRMPLYIIVVLFQEHLVNTGKASVLGGLLLAFCVTGWIGTASVVRTQFYRFKNQEYILAARTLGAGDLRLMLRHIFPNAIGTIITSSVFAIPGVITSESTFSYLGIVNFNSSTSVSLGTMMADGQAYLQYQPHILLIPAAVIAIMMIAFNLFGNGLRDAFNPSLRGADD